MLQELLQALVDSKNEAADDVLLESLRLGTEAEKTVALGALLRRKAVRGLSGVIEQYDALPESLQHGIIANIGGFHHALRECGRSDRTELRLAAMKLIAISRQGLLAYVLSENLHDLDETLSKAATDAMVAMARWVAMETRALQKGAAKWASAALCTGVLEETKLELNVIWPDLGAVVALNLRADRSDIATRSDDQSSGD